MTIIIAQIILILVLTALNAFFAASEMALVSVDKLTVQAMAAKGNAKARQLLTVINRPSHFLSTIQVGITFAGFFSSASAATGLADPFASQLAKLGVPYASQVAVIVITLLLSYFILVFGELLPKRIAIGNALHIAMFSIAPLRVIGIITAPFVKVLTLSIAGLMRLFHIRSKDTRDVVTEDKIRFLLRKSKMDGTIKPLEEHRIQRIFEFNDIMVKDIMVPLEKAFMMDIDADINRIIRDIALKKHSRVPIYKGSPNRIIGIVHFKNIFDALQHGPLDRSDLLDLLDAPIEIDSEAFIDKVFLKLQRSRKHMAIVKSREGKVVGLVTLEDMIEEIFGNIEDEFDVH